MISTLLLIPACSGTGGTAPLPYAPHLYDLPVGSVQANDLGQLSNGTF